MNCAILEQINNLINITKSIEMDNFSALFANFSPTARVFHSGTFCSDEDYFASEGLGHLHLLRDGKMTVSRFGSPSLNSEVLSIDQPSVLFYPKPCNHRLHPDKTTGVNLLCATVDLGIKERNPLAMMAFPEVFVIPLQDISAIAPTLELLFAEAFDTHCGRQAALDRLTEYFLILLFRHAINSKMLNEGILAALNDPRLSKSISAMHDHPGYPWSLETLADEAGMSRARFAVRFRAMVGSTPLEYLTNWRINVAKTLLMRGKSIKTIAPSVGYQSSTAFSRIFARKLGISPGVWLSKQHESADNEL